MKVTKDSLKLDIMKIVRITGLEIHLSCAYGGYSAVVTATGANLVSTGHVPAKVLADKLDAFLEGWFLAKEQIAKGDIHNEV